MKIMIHNILFFLALCGCGASVCACASSDDREPVLQVEYVPVAPDYNDATMWVTYSDDSDGQGADVFYIPSTWEFDYTAPDGRVSHYADPSLAQHRADMKIEMDGVAEYMLPGNRFYSPFYRHITLDTWATLNEDTINRRYKDVAFVDVKNAFDHFVSERDADRPFILAGFSQGGKSVVELLKILPEDLRDKMVAAYVMGYKVTPEDVSVAPWIKGAQGADDTGVVVSYNSVSDVEYIKPVVAAPTVMCINPVNWRTDATPAILDDTITVTLSEPYKVLVVKGYDGSSLPNILDILNVGDYHGAEPWLYSKSLAANIQTRLAAYKSHPNDSKSHSCNYKSHLPH